MTRDWYQTYAQRFGGYRKLWDSTIEGENGEAAFTACLRKTIPTHPRVLDVGCGDGLYTLHMSALAEQMTGIDYAPEMIALARRYQESAAIPNVDFRVCHTSEEMLPGAPQAYDLIYSRRGPSSHLPDVRRVLRPGGLVAGLHTGGQEAILGRVAQADLHLLVNQEFRGVEIFPTLEDFALYLTRVPGFPDYTAPENRAELLDRAQQAETLRGYEVHRWWFLWVATAEQ